MFSFFNKEIETPKTFKTEAESVKNFLQTSYHFKELKKSAARYAPTPDHANDLADFVDNIEKANNYSIITCTLGWVDPDRSDNLFAYNMGRKRISILTGALGFFSERPNFIYHAIALIDEAEKAGKIYYANINKNEDTIKKSYRPDHPATLTEEELNSFKETMKNIRTDNENLVFDESRQLMKFTNI